MENNKKINFDYCSQKKNSIHLPSCTVHGTKKKKTKTQAPWTQMPIQTEPKNLSLEFRS